EFRRVLFRSRAFHDGTGKREALGTLHMAALRGMEVIVLRPEGFALPGAIMERARRAAAASGGSVRETAEREDALAGAEVLYVKEWGATACYGDSEADARLRSTLTGWC